MGAQITDIPASRVMQLAPQIRSRAEYVIQVATLQFLLEPSVSRKIYSHRQRVACLSDHPIGWTKNVGSDEQLANTTRRRSCSFWSPFRSDLFEYVQLYLTLYYYYVDARQCSGGVRNRC